MNGRCNNDPLDAAEEICGICGGEFCSSCVITTRNRRSSRVCKQCAIEHSGLRTGARSAVASRRQVRSNTKVLSGADSPADARTGFLFFDDPESDFSVDLPSNPSEDQIDEVLAESVEVRDEPKRRRFGRLSGRRKDDTMPAGEGEGLASPDAPPSLEHTDGQHTAEIPEPTIADPGPSATELLQRLRATDIPAATHPAEQEPTREDAERKSPSERPMSSGDAVGSLGSEPLGLQAPAQLSSEALPDQDRQDADQSNPGLQDPAPRFTTPLPEPPTYDGASEHNMDHRIARASARPSASVVPRNPIVDPSFSSPAQFAPDQNDSAPSAGGQAEEGGASTQGLLGNSARPLDEAQRLPIPRPDLSQSPFATPASARPTVNPLATRPAPAVPESLRAPAAATHLPTAPMATEASAKASNAAHTTADVTTPTSAHTTSDRPFPSAASLPSAPPALGARPVEDNASMPLVQQLPAVNPDAPVAVDTDVDGNWIPPLLRGMAPPEERADSPLPKRR